MTMTLTYAGDDAEIADLAIGTCTAHRCECENPHHPNEDLDFWHLWIVTTRDDNGVRLTFAVPINPNGGPEDHGPGGRTWGFTKVSEQVWQITPSINLLDTGDINHGPREDRSIWHQTPTIVGMPVDWMPPVPEPEPEPDAAPPAP